MIKANVCRLLEHQLDADGFRVLNNGRVVYFPSTGRQQEFHLQFNQIVESARVSEIPAHFKKIPESARVKQILESARPREQPLPRWRRFLPERDQVLTALKWVGRGLRTVVAKRIEEMPEQPHRGYGGARGMGAGYEQCAPEIAARYGLDEKRYRHALREQARYDPHLSGHAHGARWCAPIGSPMHDAMIKVAERLTKNTP